MWAEQVREGGEGGREERGGREGREVEGYDIRKNNRT